MIFAFADKILKFADEIHKIFLQAIGFLETGLM